MYLHRVCEVNAFWCTFTGIIQGLRICEASCTLYRITLFKNPNLAITCNAPLYVYVQGLLLSSVDVFMSSKDFIRLWRNECLRVLHDRLICIEDKEMVQNEIKEILQTNYGQIQDHAAKDPILFGDYRLATKVNTLTRRDWPMVCISNYRYEALSVPHVIGISKME